MKRIISAILVTAMLLGCLLVLPLGVFAYRNGETPTELKIVKSTAKTLAAKALTQTYTTAQEKIDLDENMVLMTVYGQYELYANRYSGEVYVKDIVTGDILTSNPYDTSGKDMSSVAAKEFMSQIILQYRNIHDATRKTTVLMSQPDAAAYGQITIDPIENGVRVNYVLGDTTKRYLLPTSMPAKVYVENVLAPMMKQIETRIREVGRENGIPEADLASSTWDFQKYCKEKDSIFSLTELIGTWDDGTEQPYGIPTYGNWIAFDEWLFQVDSEYTMFYREQSAADQATMAPVTTISKVSDDFVKLSAVYTFYSAYDADVTTSQNIHRKDWRINNDKVGLDSDGKDLPESKWSKLFAVGYLRADAYEDENGLTIYPNSYFSLNGNLWSNPIKLQLYSTVVLSYFEDLNEALMNEMEETVGIAMPAANNAIFRIALEYVLDEKGLTVTMPARGIVFDESEYAVEYIDVLPYFGSGKVQEGGFIFYPDGSGAVIDFNDFQTRMSSVSGKVYGQDYAYYSISGKHQQTIALPVFGTVKNTTTYYMVDPYETDSRVSVNEKHYRTGSYTITYSYDDKARQIVANYPRGETRPVQYLLGTHSVTGTTLERAGFELSTDPQANTADNKYYYGNVTCVVTGNTATSYLTVGGKTTQIQNPMELSEPFFGIDESHQTGYLAVLEEGASLASLNARVNESGNNTKPYTSVYAEYVPQPNDKYNLADVMTGAESTAFYIQAKGKYEGDYSIRYLFLTDPDLAAAKGLNGTFDTTYSGMANLYQSYLVDEGVFTALTNLKNDLPLYIESFGVIQTTEKFLSIPYTADKPLTTFEDIRTMYEELKGKDITNIKFRLTGFANGGFTQMEYPVRLKWESAAGGKSGFKKLLAYVNAEDTGLEVFPNFEYLYVRNNSNIKLKDIGARSVDNRYAWHQEYVTVYQEYAKEGGIVVSSDKLDELFGKMLKKYKKYDIGSISLDGFAAELSSNFDEENFIDRETSLENICSFLAGVRESGYTSMMSTGGNVYAFRYMDYLLKAPTDSSHFNAESYTVPFWGMVAHGFLQYAGQPFNEEADKSEAFLRAIESGASLYYLLSYQNTQLLKDTFASDYYSVNYEIEKNSLVTFYQKLNETIGDLQGYRIVDHRGLAAERVQLDDEVELALTTLEEEFLTQLARATEQAVEEEKAFIRDLITFATENGIDWSNAEFDNLFPIRAKIRTFILDRQDTPTLRAVLGPESDYTGEDIATKWGKIVDAVNSSATDETKLIAEYGKTIGVVFDTDAILAAAKRAVYSDTLREDFEASIRAFITEHTQETADKIVRVTDVSYTSDYRYFTLSDALDANYKATTSTVNDHTVVIVTYTDGVNTVRFLLNFNIFAVTVRLDGEVYSLAKYGFVRLG